VAIFISGRADAARLPRDARQARDRSFRSRNLKAAAGGVFSLLGYGAIIWALSLSPMGQVSALRETSILFAVLMGRIFLREPLTMNRIVAGTTIAIGAICLSI
jgi:drug/metabolite transporter (DMT)-like permease